MIDQINKVKLGFKAIEDRKYIHYYFYYLIFSD